MVAILKDHGLRMTPQRRAIVAAVMRTTGHISPSTLARRVQADMPGVNASTIYRTLALLEEVGVLAHAHLEGGAEYHRAEQPPHAHLACSRCGAEIELSLDATRELERLIVERHDFAPDLTHFAISGLCRDCRSRG